MDFGSTGTLHATTLIILFNPTFKKPQIGVSAIACPNAASAGFTIAGCTEQIIDTAGADRSWITSDGPHVYISYHDSGNSSLIHVQRSDDDGFTWQRVGDPIVGSRSTDGGKTWAANLVFHAPLFTGLNNIFPALAVDPVTGKLYAAWSDAHTIGFSTSSDQGSHWSKAVSINIPPAQTA